MSLTSIFQDIADAIRTKTGKSDSIYPVDMASEIEGISSGTQNLKILEAGKSVCNLDITITITEV